MRRAMLVLREVFDKKDFAPHWPENAIKNNGIYLVWIIFNSDTGIAKIHIDHAIDFELFIEAFQSQFASSYLQGQGAKGKVKAKGKEKFSIKAAGNTEDPSKFPFIFQFKQVTDWAKEYAMYKIETRCEGKE